MTRFWSRARPSDSLPQQQPGGHNIAASFLASVGMGGGDDSFIPGLGAGKSFVPTPASKFEDGTVAGMGAGGDDSFVLPGLGMSGFGGNILPLGGGMGMGAAGSGIGGFTLGTGANAPLPGTGTQNFGWNTRQQQQPPPQGGQGQTRPGGTYGSFY
ncbi:hypothetical protein NDA16_001335 [Ustilago loliicola]|nr:hypothetical protein NDA16_001335 [Ustilago loliicola]